MRDLSRREFGTALLATLPLAGVLRATRAGTVVGVTTSAFSDLPRVPGRDNVDDIIRAVRSLDASHVELAMQNVEPAPPPTAPVMGGTAAYPRRIVLTPEQIAATNMEARAALRTWRLSSPAAPFEDARDRFARAGIRVHSCALAFDATFTDEEIEATLAQVAALGVSTVSSPLTLSMARRLVPFVARHHLTVAIQNQTEGNRAGALGAATLDQALALSPAFSVKLDIGAVTASDGDAVSVLRRHLPRTASVLVGDRLRHGGASQPLGEGDTPIAAVLGLLPPDGSVPVWVGYDYVGLRSSVEELRASLQYVRRLDGARG